MPTSEKPAVRIVALTNQHQTEELPRFGNARMVEKVSAGDHSTRAKGLKA